MAETEDFEKIPFEEALNQTGFGLYNYSMAVLSGVAVISFVCIFYSTTIIVPINACELATTGPQRGMLVAGPIVGCIIGAVFWGSLADNHGRRRTLLISLLAGATLNALASFSVNWVMLLILQFVASLMISGQYSLSITIVSESVPLAKRNEMVLLVTSIFLLSQGLMAVLAMPIIPLDFSFPIPYLGIKWNSWRTLLVVYSLPSLLTSLWLYFMQESPKFVYAKGNENEALEILKIIHRVNTGGRGHEFQVKGLLRDSSQSVEGQLDPFNSTQENHLMMLFKPPLLKYTLIMMLLFLLEQQAAFKVWLPTIAHHFTQIMQSGGGTNLTLCDVIALNLDSEVNGGASAAPCTLDPSALMLVVVVAVSLSVTNSLVTLVVGRIGRRNMVVLLTSVSGMSGVLVNLVPNAFGSAALFLLQLLGAVVIGLYTAICVSLFPTYLRASAMTLSMTGARVANFVSIQLVNYLLKHDCDLAFIIYGSLMACSALVAFLLPNDYRTRQYNELQEN